LYSRVRSSPYTAAFGSHRRREGYLKHRADPGEYRNLWPGSTGPLDSHKMQCESRWLSHILLRALVLSGQLDLPWVLLMARTARGVLREVGLAKDATCRRDRRCFGIMDMNFVIRLKRHTHEETPLA
jgi:hypothetical protein